MTRCHCYNRFGRCDMEIPKVNGCKIGCMGEDLHMVVFGKAYGKRLQGTTHLVATTPQLRELQSRLRRDVQSRSTTVLEGLKSLRGGKPRVRLVLQSAAAEALLHYVTHYLGQVEVGSAPPWSDDPGELPTYVLP